MSGMKSGTIKMVIKKKLDDWLSSIKDEELVKLAKRDVIVTGGCICNMLEGTQVNDYDVYFRTYETTLAMAKYYCAKFIELNPAVEGVNELPLHLGQLF